MPPSRRTGAARPVAKQAPTPPSIPQSTRPMAAAPPPPGARPAAPPAYGSPMGQAPPPAMAPPAAAPAMPQAGGGGGMFSGIMGSVVSGMAMGTGSAVAHRAVDSMMGPRQVEHVHTGAPAPAAPAAAAPGMQCGNETQLFQDCIKNTGGDIAPCQSYMDMMMQCKAQFPSA